MGVGDRLARLERRVRDRPGAGPFRVVLAVPAGDAAAGGRPPGLYRDGPPGSLAGLLVYDPAGGGPAVPDGAVPPWGRVIVCGPDADGRES